MFVQRGERSGSYSDAVFILSHHFLATISLHLADTYCTDSDLGVSVVVSAVDTLCTPYLSNQLWTVLTVGRYGIAGNFCRDFNLANWQIFTKSPKLILPNTQVRCA